VKHQKTFTSLRICLPDNISLNSVAAKAATLRVVAWIWFKNCESKLHPARQFVMGHCHILRHFGAKDQWLFACYASVSASVSIFGTRQTAISTA
jgi:hypothetical protein